MLDVPMIQTRGFKNIPGGFEVRLRLPYYRGLWTGHLAGATVTVDGHTYDPEEPVWRIGELMGTVSELQHDDDGRWPIDVPATLSFQRSDPLSIGFHDVEVFLGINTSYIPAPLMPVSWTEARRMVITR